MVWPQTMDRDSLDAQLTGVQHTGILRTKVGKFMVRCTATQLPLVRQAVCQDDTRFKHAPNLVVTRKWRVSNVPADLSAQRLSEALQLCHKWDQVPIGPPNPKGKGPTWSPILGSAVPPPQQQLLIADHLCVITEIGVQASLPRATILAGSPAPSVVQTSPQAPPATVSAQMQEGLKQTEILLTAQITSMVEERLADFNKLQSQVGQITTQMQQIQTVSAAHESHIQAVDASIVKLSTYVEDRHKETQGEMSKLGQALNQFACQTQHDFKAFDAGMEARLEAMGDLLVAKLGAAARKRPAEEPTPKMEES
eukprot:3230246-Amphidinium_carterae.1